MKIKIAMFFLCSLVASLSYAEEKTLEQEQKKEEKIGLEDRLDFNKRLSGYRRLEFSPFGGYYLGDQLNNSYLGGARLNYRVSKAFHVGADFFYNRVKFDELSSVGQIIQHKNEFGFFAVGTYSIPAIQRMGKKGIQELDLFTTLGVGMLRQNSKNIVAGYSGGGMIMYTSKPWLAIRFDAGSYMYVIPRVSDSKFVSDWVFTVGPSFAFLGSARK